VVIRHGDNLACRMHGPPSFPNTLAPLSNMLLVALLESHPLDSSGGLSGHTILDLPTLL
jgi:hypothetical protein